MESVDMHFEDQLVVLREGQYTQKDIHACTSSSHFFRTRDIFRAQQEELFYIDNPTFVGKDLPDEFESYYQRRIEKLGEELSGTWVFYKWSGLLLHCVSEDELSRLLTNRNQYLITQDEQEKLAQFRVGIVGLSIGSEMAKTIVHSGASRVMKISDNDILETSNLNRVRAGLGDIGMNKVDSAAKSIYEMNPFQRLLTFPEGITDANVEDFINGGEKLDVLFEAIDDFRMKIRMREVARAEGVPVVMLTNLGDTILVDVERFDTDQNLPVLHGVVAGKEADILQGKFSGADLNQLAIDFVEEKNVPERAIRAVRDIGTHLVGRPQLMSSVNIAAGFATNLVKRFALGEGPATGRYKFDFASVLK